MTTSQGTHAQEHQSKERVVSPICCTHPRDRNKITAGKEKKRACTNSVAVAGRAPPPRRPAAPPPRREMEEGVWLKARGVSVPRCARLRAHD